jgi:ABC-type glycerol-3-phosphate transport system permease component
LLTKVNAAFQRCWNNFLWTLVVAQDPDIFTLQVGLSYIQNREFGTNYGLLMSGAAFSAIPMIVFFFAFQRYFVQGFRIGAVKGCGLSNIHFADEQAAIHIAAFARNGQP